MGPVFFDGSDSLESLCLSFQPIKGRNQHFSISMWYCEHKYVKNDEALQYYGNGGYITWMGR